jgi:hypothetical protein
MSVSPPLEHQKADELSAKIEQIMGLYLTSEPESTILPLVDEAFKLFDGVDEICQLLDYLPKSLTSKKFLLVLEKERSRRSAQVAKANLSTVEQDLKSESPAFRRKLYLLMYECLMCEPAFEADAQHMLVSYLSTFTKVDDYKDCTNEIEEKACLAIISTLKLAIWRFDEVGDLVPVRALAASKVVANKQLFTLFDIFCNKGINEYQHFYTSNRELIENSWGLAHKELHEKIRMLSLCRLAQEKRAEDNINVLTYSDIMSALNVDEDEVEPIVIRAVSLKLLNCRIDQTKKLVRVSYTHHAIFTHDQWRHLHDTLGTFKDSVAGLLKRFDELRVQSLQAE